MKRAGLPMVVLMVFSTLAAATPDGLNQQMRRISDAMLILLPQVHDHNGSREEIHRNLDRLEQMVAEVEPHVRELPVGSRLNYAMLQRQLTRVTESLEQGSMFLMKGALANSFELCAGCHSLDAISTRAFGVSKLRQLDEYLAAEYSYLTRDYEAAEAGFMGFVESAPATDSRRGEALMRLFAIALVNEQEANDTVVWLDRLSRNKQLTADEASRVSAWRNLLVKASGQERTLFSPLSAESPRALARLLDSEWPEIRFLLNDSEQQAYWMLTRTRLNEFLGHNPREADLPVLLYWLGVSDRHLRYQFYESLASVYLEECIRDFPTHDYASTCYDEYELLMIVSYSGSGGIRLPDDVTENLSELRALIARNR